MTEATREDPAPAGRPGRSFAAPILVAVCLLGAAGVYVYETDRNAPATVHSGAVPAQPAAVAAALPTPSQSSSSQSSLAQASVAQPGAAHPGPMTKPAQPSIATTSAAQQQAQAQQAQAHAAVTPAPPAQPAAHLPAPSVDVVRLDQYGSLVMAGRAEPGETLTIRSGVTMLGTVTADSDGQWVFLPDATLPSGVHQLSVADHAASTKDIADQTTVLLSLPGAGGAGATATVAGSTLKSGPMIVLSQGNEPPRLLLAPPGSHPGPVGLDIVQYDEQGRIKFTGHARPGRMVRLYVNDHALGDAQANARGIWTLTPAKDMPPGIYQLRTDELAPNGRVLARSEVPFARASLTQVLAPGQGVVQPGDCLWTIARHDYGRGVEYTAIFAENLDQIRDPAKIYPGQAFHMPTPDEAAHAPPVSAITKLKRRETHLRGETTGG
jgi:nucleoid-associated protein YgaU